MASNQYSYAPIIPIPNPQALLECLATGQVTVSSALAQINHFLCETLKSVEDFSTEQAKLHSEGKSKVEKMDKIIYELSEKCQAMQQALLFKEEKLEEKCREIERYKMICEMNAKNALKPPKNLIHYEINNNIPSIDGDEKPQDRKDCIIKLETTRTDTPQSCVKRHAKLNDNQAHLSQFVSPFELSSRPPVQTIQAYQSNQVNAEEDDRLRAQYYPGGPSKRKISLNSCKKDNSYDYSACVRQRLESIGGVNIRPAHIDGGPVPVNRLIPQGERSFNEEPNKRMRVEVTDQRNEIFSSSGNNAQRMKQKIVEKDLQRQVAGGSWTRLASRRKKNWPF